ncbi:sodium:solute symporter family protein [Chlamydiifrater phoenicopteri]|uniref:sodium:solute symporter family protein n=1 Tax=Chlamydiifrater phoenicopteri TaxID=2681469 RepID=UPI001BCC9379|nr:sodium:solute symporter family protein [Chlamydiifrater phoenicopteri]
MNVALFLSCLLILQGACLLIARGNHSSQNHREFFLADRSVGWFPLTMTFLATQIGGGSLIGLSEEAYRYGYSAIFLAMGTVIGFFILGIGPGRKLAASSYNSILDVFSDYYASSKLRRIAFFLSVGSLFCILSAQLIALYKLCSAVPYGSWLVLTLWIMLAWYTAQGGLRAVIKTDIIQVLFIILAISYVCLKLASAPLATIITPLLDSASLPKSSLISGLFVPLIFMFIEQDMMQRCLAAKSKKIVSISTILAGLLLAGFQLIPIWMGVTAKKMAPTLAGGSAILEMTQRVCGGSVSAILCSVIVVAILSTADSLINSISQLLSSDIPLIQKKPKLSSFLLPMTAFLLVPFQQSVFRCILIGYGLSVCCLSVPVLACFLGYRASKASAFAAVLSGGIIYLLSLLEFISGSEITAWCGSLCAFSLIELGRKFLPSTQLKAKTSEK